ncbi:UxaA family hydrolase [Brevibacillus fulvus]|uniref:Altronate dehydratase small subunit n=1 Tax=Brevibacillus fulvus TaxID=1125967 RepID=A0A938Y1T7_9BACL|nr:UxaA family hydrolase [Brevibacillus fulvus]MBM7589615.1 altronate dehydratase small subunit [Brevibacillus fulvus]
MDSRKQALMLKAADSVAVALRKLEKGSVVSVFFQERMFQIVLKDSIEFGHKFAVVPMRKGDDVRKYGEVIGMASRDIAVGEHVHVHNVEGKRGRGDKIGRRENGTAHGLSAP